MNPALVRAWDVHSRWSQAADISHRQIDRRRTGNLVLLISGALAGAVAGIIAESQVSRVVSGVAGGCLVLAALFQQRSLSSSQMARWLAQRNAAETMSSAVFRSLALDPTDDASATAKLDATLEQVQASNLDYLLTFDAVKVRASQVPTLDGFEGYVESRARSQARWHRNKVGALTAKARRLRLAELGSTLGAGALSIWATVAARAEVMLLVGALTTVAATCAAHLAASKYERIAAGYAATAGRIDRAIVRLDHGGSAMHRESFVDEIESILATQNQVWQGMLSAD
jgi:hypothetical protein